MATATTTPADVLSKLQAAWRTPAPSAADAASDTEAEAEPVIVAYCGPHNDPTQWEYSPDKYKRPGWHTAHCKRCGRFIGYQPPPDRKRKRQQTETKDNTG